MAEEVVRVAVRAKLIELLKMLDPLAESLGGSFVAECQSGQLKCRLDVFPLVGAAESGEPWLTPCERDCFEVVQDAGRRITGPDLRRVLESRQQIHGESTIAKSLARLVKLKLITPGNKRDGYGVCAKGTTNG